MTATTTAPPAVSDGREWELVGGSGNRACRGSNSTDNSPSYYEVRGGVERLEDCQALCLAKLPQCKGVEYSPGRCELWLREGGISAWTERVPGGFTCLRFGWPVDRLTPMEGGADRACRGDGPGDNSESYYAVSVAADVEDCKAQCAAAPVCFGIEFGRREGRCEIWTRAVGASAKVPGYECLRFDQGPAAGFVVLP